MLRYFFIVVIMYHWINLMKLVVRSREEERRGNRRWHVRPHITNFMRDNYGAYEMLFLYFANNDSEEFYNMVRMDLQCFRVLYNLLYERLLKTSLRRPLSGELRLVLTLK